MCVTRACVRAIFSFDNLAPARRRYGAIWSGVAVGCLRSRDKRGGGLKEAGEEGEERRERKKENILVFANISAHSSATQQRSSRSGREKRSQFRYVYAQLSGSKKSARLALRLRRRSTDVSGISPTASSFWNLHMYFYVGTATDDGLTKSRARTKSLASPFDSLVP